MQKKLKPFQEDYFKWKWLIIYLTFQLDFNINYTQNDPITLAYEAVFLHFVYVHYSRSDFPVKLFESSPEPSQ